MSSAKEKGTRDEVPEVRKESTCAQGIPPRFVTCAPALCAKWVHVDDGVATWQVLHDAQREKEGK
jgi:hypothetical protein